MHLLSERLFFDALGSILSFISCVGYVRLKKNAWLIACLSNIINCFFFYKTKLLASALLRAIYLITNLWGYRSWVKMDKNKKPDQHIKTSLDRSEIILFCFGAIACFFFAGTVLKRFNTTLPHWDIWMVYTSLWATWLGTKRNINAWIIWGVIDIGSIWVYWKTASPFHVMLMLSYLPLAYAGYRKWLMISQQTMPETAEA